ncbi:efflux RND transporter periplasmic adaptor subunit [Candidatus Nomurabacteria bacterium]|nr:efflux RND transporter periplasmic adaptor subunit [Candidatus Nomurabacteria bacterium]
MTKIKNILNIIQSWSTRRKIFFSVLFLFVIFIGYKKFGPVDNSANIVSEKVAKINLAKTVLATGQVTSKTDLSLSFTNTGIVRVINVSVGDHVYKGQILASMDQGTELASLTKARAAVALAQAKYNKILEGSTDSEIALAKVLLENAKTEYTNTKIQQDVLVDEAQNKYLSTTSSTNSGTNLITARNDYEYAKKTRDTVLSSLQSMVNQRQAELDIKQASARTSDIDLAKADILSAEGELQSANAKYENTLLRAPSSGTITSVNIKLGELAQSLKEVMILQDVSNLYLEANINEANIAIVKIGQPVSITYDSIGPDQIFKGEVFSIDPSSNNTDGIVNYKIKIALKDKNPIIRPGMNANITVDILSKNNVLAIPLLAVKKVDNISIVQLITNDKRKLYKEVPVVTGMIGDGNLVEIQSGLNEGDSVVVINKK